MNIIPGSGSFRGCLFLSRRWRYRADSFSSVVSNEPVKPHTFYAPAAQDPDKTPDWVR